MPHARQREEAQDPLLERAGVASVAGTAFFEGAVFPLIVEGHGYGGSRVKAADRPAGGDPSTFGRLLDAGYGIISIDQRGHGERPRRHALPGRLIQQRVAVALHVAAQVAVRDHAQ